MKPNPGFHTSFLIWLMGFSTAMLFVSPWAVVPLSVLLVIYLLCNPLS